jgi:malonyl-CoA/methylmalonyl-CoA synthetase
VNQAQNELPVIAHAQEHAKRIAAIDSHSSATYSALLDRSASVASALLRTANENASATGSRVGGCEDLHGARIAFLIPPGISWIATLWGIWRAGGIAVPLALSSTRPEIEYYLNDIGASLFVSDATTAATAEPIANDLRIKTLAYESISNTPAVVLPEVAAEQPAMILFTSGTTNKPKGVVTTHANIVSQICALVEAWEWADSDRIPLFLPLHHVHGIINVVSCALWSGATVEMMPRFDPQAVWDRIASGDLTVFMAVPTIYLRLIAALEASTPERRIELSRAASKLRLMVSGSAALPVPTLERWREISGHTLLERYGMTEIGMALSNPLHGTRMPGCVGRPLPGVEVRLTSENGEPLGEGVPGEIEVRGASVFSEYWGKPDATRESFRSGWFRTGDTAIVENGVYRILGRTSIDILKSGGHKISALEIEEVLLDHPSISECAVVGVPDDEWGQRVAAAVVLRAGTQLDLDSLRAWGRDKLSAYKLPSRFLVLQALPRNAMGKAVKPDVVKLFN